MYIAGIGIAIPIGAGTGSVSGHLSNSKTDSQYASVGQQSGMLAGDGGFRKRRFIHQNSKLICTNEVKRYSSFTETRKK